MYGALEGLRQEPPSDLAAGQGQEQLDEEFLDRFEHYAEGASTEQLRQKWGRVLSAEVRKPGTFSAKLLRTVDEIDAATAQLFQTICQSSFVNAVPKCLIGELPFGELSRLVMSDLLIDPGIAGHIYKYMEIKNNLGIDLWFLAVGESAVSFPKGTPLPPNRTKSTDPLVDREEAPAIPVYLLTDVGTAIAEIFSRREAFARYVVKLKEALPGVEVVEYARDSDGQYLAVAKWIA